MAYIKDEITGKWQNVETYLPARDGASFAGLGLYLVLVVLSRGACGRPDFCSENSRTSLFTDGEKFVIIHSSYE